VVVDTVKAPGPVTEFVRPVGCSDNTQKAPGRSRSLDRIADALED